MNSNISYSEFFGFRHHPFSDAWTIKKRFVTEKDSLLEKKCASLLSCGKSFAVTGPSGSGKSSFVQNLVSGLDHHSYLPIQIHYGGLKRSGVIRAIAEAMGIDSACRGVPLLVKLQKHIIETASQAKPLFPVFIVDDAQLMERESLMDLCSLMSSPQKKASASIFLIGDEMLSRTLRLNVMTPIRSRMTFVFSMEPMNETASRDFIAFRLEASGAAGNLFDRETVELVCAHSRGNRRLIMNICTMLLEEAFARNEKTIGPQLFFDLNIIDMAE